MQKYFAFFHLCKRNIILELNYTFRPQEAASLGIQSIESAKYCYVQAQVNVVCEWGSGNWLVRKRPLIYLFLSPPVVMHGGLLCIAFCLSVCPSVCLLLYQKSLDKNTLEKITRKKFITREPFEVGSPNLVWWWTLIISRSCMKVIGQRSRSPCWKKGFFP